MDSVLSIQVELQEILSQDPACLVARSTAKHDRLIHGIGPAYVLFGAGRLGKITLAGLRSIGIEPLAFADNNPDLWSRMVEGVRVVSPEEASAKFRDSACFVPTVYTSSPVRQQLQALGLRVIPFAILAWRYPAGFLPHGCLDLPYGIYREANEVRQCLALWADEDSRREYVSQLRWRTSLDDNVLPPHLPPDQIYFPSDLVVPCDDELLVDCGAYDGDTIRMFLARRGASFRRVVAIEPDPANHQCLEAYLRSLPEGLRERVTPMQLAVGSRKGQISFDATGTAASATGVGGFEVECAPLDEILDDSQPSYIKMDIEGAEADALSGAGRIISAHAPVLAICLYHKQEDLWRLPLLIRSLSDRYRLFLRRYSDDCWEQVCYAVPGDRLRFDRP